MQKTKRFHVPSPGAIIHFLLVESAIQAAWFGASKLISTPLIRDIGFLVLFVVGIVAVAWYLPKIGSGLAAFKRKSISVTDKYTWLEGLVNSQWHNPNEYLSSRLVKVFPSSSPTEIGIVVEWFNRSIFDMKFESVKGEVQMGALGFAPESLGHQIMLVNKPTISACRTATCTCYIQVSDRTKTDQFRDAIGKSKPLGWIVGLEWDLSTVGFSRLVSIPQSSVEAITIVPSRS